MTTDALLALLGRIERDAATVNEALAAMKDDGEELANAHNLSGGMVAGVRRVAGWIRLAQKKGES